jgi:hypothetical protein
MVECFIGRNLIGLSYFEILYQLLRDKTKDFLNYEKIYIKANREDLVLLAVIVPEVDHKFKEILTLLRRRKTVINKDTLLVINKKAMELAEKYMNTEVWKETSVSLKGSLRYRIRMWLERNPSIYLLVFLNLIGVCTSFIPEARSENGHLGIFIILSFILSFEVLILLQPKFSDAHLGKLLLNIPFSILKYNKPSILGFEINSYEQASYDFLKLLDGVEERLFVDFLKSPVYSSKNYRNIKDTTELLRKFLEERFEEKEKNNHKEVNDIVLDLLKKEER